MFDVFNNIEVQAAEQGKKNLNMQPEAISYLVNNFFTFYRMSASWRIVNTSYERPIEKFVASIEGCLAAVNGRTHDTIK